MDHCLLLASADRLTGAVHVHHHVLFPAGVRLRPGADATATVTVHGGATGNTAVLLPVLAGPPAGGITGPTVLGVGRTALGALEPARLTFVLRGPGEIALAATGDGPPRPHEGGGAQAPPAPGGATPAPTALDDPDLNLTALVTGLPRRIVRPPRLEVFCTVELSGADAAETEERLAFVRDLIGSLARHRGTGSALRVGAVGHYDHAIHENGYAPRRILLMPPVPAGTPLAALAALDAWEPARRRQDTVSSLEDALRTLVPLATASPPATRRYDGSP